MKSFIKKRIISMLLVCILIIPYTIVAGGTTTNSDLNSAKDKQTNLNKKIEDTKAELAKLAADKSDIESYVKQLDAKMSTIDTMINTLNDEMVAKQTEITDAQAQLEQAKIDSAEQYESMKLRIKYMYEHNTESYLTVLLTSNDMADLLNKAEYINKISKYDREMLIKYVATEQLIADTEAQLQSDYEELTTMKDSVEAQKASLELVQSAKTTELASLNSKSATATTYAAQLEKDLAAQEKEIAAMEAEIKRQEEEARKAAELAAAGGKTTITTTPTVTYDGGMFLWPTPSTRITSPYGDTADRSSGHNGVDIGAVKIGVSGDPIYAAYDGVVTISTYSSSAGNWIWINHGGGLYTVYMHNSSLLVSVGTKVKKGQKIALMGTTGNSTGVHLHFGVRLNGTYVNPMSYFR